MRIYDGIHLTDLSFYELVYFLCLLVILSQMADDSFQLSRPVWVSQPSLPVKCETFRALLISVADWHEGLLRVIVAFDKWTHFAAN